MWWELLKSNFRCLSDGEKNIGTMSELTKKKKNSEWLTITLTHSMHVNLAPSIYIMFRFYRRFIALIIHVEFMCLCVPKYADFVWFSQLFSFILLLLIFFHVNKFEKFWYLSSVCVCVCVESPMKNVWQPFESVLCAFHIHTQFLSYNR